MNAVLTNPSFGKYQLIASLGRGGMANVHLALVAGPGGFNKLLVVKSLREDVVHDVEGGMEMFLDEARLTARMVHPNIVSTYEVGENAGTFFLAMEYLEGQTYRAVCNRGRASRLTVEDELRILSEAARGLHYAHELCDYDGTPLHVVHRDVSPQNIFVTYDGLVKLLDFGIADSAEAEHVTRIGVVKGKLDYIAPEQLRAEPVDRRADVFSLGVMLWEVITGKRFAGGRSLAGVVKAQNRLTGGERKLREVQPDVPEELARLVDRCIALEAEARLESAGAFADALDEFLASTTLKPNARSLSALVTPMFEVERLQLRKTIEEQIRLSKQRGAAGSREAALPVVRMNDLESSSGLWTGTAGTSARKPDRTRPLGAALVVAVMGALVGGGLALVRDQRELPVQTATVAPTPIAPAPVALRPSPALFPEPPQAAALPNPPALRKAPRRVRLEPHVDARAPEVSVPPVVAAPTPAKDVLAPTGRLRIPSIDSDDPYASK